MDEKEKILDELFVSEDEAQKPVKPVQEQTPSKDTDSKTIGSAVTELSREFDKKNKEEFNRRKQEEEVKEDVEDELAEPQKKRKSKVSFLLSLISFPFVLIGGIIIWNYMISPNELNPAVILTVLMCVAGFAVGVKSFILGVKKEGGFKVKIKPILIGLLFFALSVLIIIFRPYIEQFAFLVTGCLGALVAFIAGISAAVKSGKDKSNIVKLVMSILACVGAVLLILAGTAFTQVTVYLQITGIYLALVGCALFVF